MYLLIHSINSDDEKQKNAILDYLTDVKLSRQELDESMNLRKEPKVHSKFEENYEEDIKVVIHIQQTNVIE